MAAKPKAAPEIVIAPQPGPQTKFLETSADIAVYGGSAGGGKSFGLLLEPIRHYDNPNFNALIFRRTGTQVRNPGGLWDESVKLYRQLGAYPRPAAMQWIFPQGWALKFAHMEYEKTKYEYQGAQITYIGFDELTHFTQSQFTYMLSRNRSMAGVPGLIRATCNPDPDSWVRKWVDWWIGPNGFPIPERSGVVRWFVRPDGKLIWADTKAELVARYGKELQPKSFTFIPSSVYDNKILLETDPSYLASLMALDPVEKARLLGGNWNIRFAAGEMFKREWFHPIKAIPHGWTSVIRFWDRAATKPSPSNLDPDWTRGLKLYKYPNGTWVVADIKSCQDTPYEVERLIKGTAEHDGHSVQIMAQQDPGSAGVAEAQQFTRMLQGYQVKTASFSKDKITRAKAISAQSQAGNVFVLQADWNDEFYSELEGFPSAKHDDQVDCFSGAYNELAGTTGWASQL